jgi:hypothetical protein
VVECSIQQSVLYGDVVFLVASRSQEWCIRSRVQSARVVEGIKFLKKRRLSGRQIREVKCSQGGTSVMFSKGYTSCSAGGCARIMTVSADTGGAKLASISQTWMMAPKAPREKVDDQATHSMGCFAVQTCASGRQASIFPGPSTVRYRGLQGLLLGSSQAGGAPGGFVRRRLRQGP